MLAPRKRCLEDKENVEPDNIEPGELPLKFRIKYWEEKVSNSDPSTSEGSELKIRRLVEAVKSLPLPLETIQPPGSGP